MLIKRETGNNSSGLHTSYRPCAVDELVSNEVNKNILRSYLEEGKLPHTLLLTGHAGCGKTTVARIIALGLNCQAQDKPTATPCMKCESCSAITGGYSMDCREVNVGKESGKGDVAAIVENLSFAPFNSRYKVVIFDEAHELTSAAKDLLLKEMEDGYKHVYLIFCTNRPDELKSKKTGGDAFLSRCVRLNFNTLTNDEIRAILVNVLEFEGHEFNEEVINLIIEETKGVPRDALVALSNIIAEGSWDLDNARKILSDVIAEDNPDIMELSKSLMHGKWSESVKLFEELSKQLSPETIRIVVASYFIGCLKNSRRATEARKFSEALDILTEPIYQTGKPGNFKFINNMFKIVDIMRGKGE